MAHLNLGARLPPTPSIRDGINTRLRKKLLKIQICMAHLNLGASLQPPSTRDGIIFFSSSLNTTLNNIVLKAQLNLGARLPPSIHDGINTHFKETDKKRYNFEQYSSEGSSKLGCLPPPNPLNL